MKAVVQSSFLFPTGIAGLGARGTACREGSRCSIISALHAEHCSALGFINRSFKKKEVGRGVTGGL